MVLESKDSMLAVIAGLISPIFKPLGFGDYRVVTALISGVMAKEGVVASLSMLFGSQEAIFNAFTISQGFCLLIFCLLYTPCIAALASIKRELGYKWAFGVAVFQFLIAYLVTGIFSLIFLIF